MYEYVRRQYGVNPIVGQRARHTELQPGNDECIIQPEDPCFGHYVMVKFASGLVGPAHPTALEYLDQAPAGDPAAAARASFEEDHSLGKRSWGLDASRESIPTTQGAEGRNWAGE